MVNACFLAYIKLVDRQYFLILVACVGLVASLPRAWGAEGDAPDFSGFWAGMFEPEDQQYRGPGPDFGDFRGLPLSEAGLAKAKSWNPDDDYLPENLSKPHSPTNIMRSSFPFQIIQEPDMITLKMESCEQVRKVHMGGVSHPPEEAPHTFMGHSIGHWEGQTLVVHTTHIIENYVRRNGVAHSEKVQLEERYTRDGDYLLLMMTVEDPVYFSAPFMRVIAFRHRPDITALRPYPCGG